MHSSKKMMVLDGNSILNRSFYGIKNLSTKDGRPTNAIYGFLMTLISLKNSLTPDAVAIAFDLKKPTFRHKMYDAYKAQRKKMPEELASQLIILKELLKALGYKIVECEGFEADDILGTFAKACEDFENDCLIATGDKDSLQLVSAHVSVRITATKFGKPEYTLYNEEKIMEIYGVKPTSLIDVKAIQGDASDNIPGVKGIGQKGALELVKKFGNLDYIYNNLDTLDIKENTKKKLLESKDNAFLSKVLGTVRKDVPIDTNIDTYIPSSGSPNEASNILSSLEMFSMIEKLSLNTKKSNTPVEHISSFGVYNICEFKGNSAENLYFVPFYEKKSLTKIIFTDRKDLYICDLKAEAFQNSEQYKALKRFMEDAKIPKYSHDIKTIRYALDSINIQINNVKFDSMLAAYLLSASSTDYDLHKIMLEYKLTDTLDISDNTLSYLFFELCDKLYEEIKLNDQLDLLDEIEFPLSEILYNMEKFGIRVDKRGLEKYGEELSEKLVEIKSEIYDEVGYEFNINSPKQLGEALFEKLLLPTGKKTKSGYSTNADVLESLRNYHPAVELIMEYRTLAKLKSTYCDSLVKQIEKDGRIHTSFNQTETRTGRISSMEPNLQNIPVRTDVGRELRKFFVAENGNVLIDADYSQIELRVLAHLSQDDNMIGSFLAGDDFHAITASKVFNVPISMVTPLMRSRAKAVNFGVVYGIGAFSLSKDTGVTRKEAQNYIDSYFEHYPKVKIFMDKSIQFAKDNGYSKTMFERRRYLPELRSSNFNLRAFGERVARNMPIQGTSADIIKIAMINVEKHMRSEGLRARLILQVHDELIVESPESEASMAMEILETEMQNAVKLIIPLSVSAYTGKTWYEAKI